MRRPAAPGMVTLSLYFVFGNDGCSDDTYTELSCCWLPSEIDDTASCFDDTDISGGARSSSGGT